MADSADGDDVRCKVSALKRPDEVMAHCSHHKRDSLVDQLDQDGCIITIDQDMFDRGGGIKVPRVFMITHDGSKDADMVKPAQETRKSKYKDNDLECQEIVIESSKGLLGSGGFGTVHRAKLIKNEKCEELISLKQGLLLGSENAGTNKHIIREAECVSQLREHPMDYIIAFKFVCQECSDAPQARVFIGMEYFAGYDLAEIIRSLIRNGRKFTQRQMIAILRKTTEAVHHLQTKLNMLHCDIKPSNILFNSDNLDLKLIDFGCAMTYGDSAQGGTPEYMAPEILKDAASASWTKSDIYSIGAVMHKVITFQAPYQHIRQHIRQQLDTRAPRHKTAAEFRSMVLKQLEEDEHLIMVGEKPPELSYFQSLFTDEGALNFDHNQWLYQIVSGMLSYCPSYRPTVDDILHGIDSMKSQIAPGSGRRNSAHDADISSQSKNASWLEKNRVSPISFSNIDSDDLPHPCLFEFSSDEKHDSPNWMMKDIIPAATRDDDDDAMLDFKALPFGLTETNSENRSMMSYKSDISQSYAHRGLENDDVDEELYFEQVETSVSGYDNGYDNMSSGSCYQVPPNSSCGNSSDNSMGSMCDNELSPLFIESPLSTESPSSPDRDIDLPEELDLRLIELHDNFHTQLVLHADPVDQTELTTLVLITHTSENSGPIDKFLVVISGERTCIPSFTGYKSGNSLKISTLHIRYQDLTSLTADERHTPVEGLPPHVIITNPDHLSKLLTATCDQLSLKDDLSKLGVLFGMETYKCSPQLSLGFNSIEKYLQVVLHTNNNPLDVVQGSIALHDSLGDSNDPKTLNRVCDSDTVTVTTMTVQQSHGDPVTLHLLVAGDAEDPITRYSKDSFFSTCRVRNDSLYAAIQNNFKADLLPQIDEDNVITDWVDNYPLFAVTSKIPACHGDDLTLTAIKPSKTYNDQRAGEFTYCHPEVIDMYITVGEPQSPPPVIGHSKAKGEPRFGTGRLKKQTRMSCDMQRSLELKQKKVNHSLRQYKDKKSYAQASSAVTAVVITKKTQNQTSVRTTVFLVCGILPENQSYLYGDADRHGLMITLTRIYSYKLNKLLRDKWNRRMTDPATRSWSPHLRLRGNEEYLANIQAEDLAAPEERRYGTFIDAGNYGLECRDEGQFFIIDRDNRKPMTSFMTSFMSINMNNEKVKLTQLGDATPSSSLELNLRKFLKDQGTTNSKSTETNGQSSSAGDPVNIIIIESKSAVPNGKRGIQVVSEQYYVLAIGNESDVGFDSVLEYDDPLCMVNCFVSCVDDVSMSRLVEVHWESLLREEIRAEGIIGENHMAKHVIYLCRDESEFNFHRIPLVLKDNVVRFKDAFSKKEKLNLQIWTHEKKVQNKREYKGPGTSASSATKTAQNNGQPHESYSSNTFQYATTHIKLTKSHLPNQIGYEGPNLPQDLGACAMPDSKLSGTSHCVTSLFLSWDNGAHIKFERPE